MDDLDVVTDEERPSRAESCSMSVELISDDSASEWLSSITTAWIAVVPFSDVSNDVPAGSPGALMGESAFRRLAARMSTKIDGESESHCSERSLGADELGRE